MNNSISFIIPVYNPPEQLLRRCVNSVLSQTSDNYELILVDDGSQTETAILCDEYQKYSRVKVIHKKNGGVTSARNVGIEKATKEWICFIDNDDWIESNTVEILNKSIGKRQSDIVYFSTKRFTNTNVKTFHTLPFAKNNTFLDKQQYQRIILDFVADGFYETVLPHGFLTVWGKLFRREFVKNNKIRFDEKLTIADDICFNIDALINEIMGVLYIDEPLYNRYSNLESDVHSYHPEIIQNDILFLNHLKTSFEKVNIQKSYKQKALNKRYVICIFGLLGFDMGHYKNKKLFKERLKDFKSVTRSLPYSAGINSCDLKLLNKSMRAKVIFIRLHQEWLILKLKDLKNYRLYKG